MDLEDLVFGVSASAVYEGNFKGVYDTRERHMCFD